MKVEESINVTFDETNNSTEEGDSAAEDEMDIVTKEVTTSPSENRKDERHISN